MDLLKVPRFLYQKRLRNKGHLNLATEFMKGFSLDIFYRLLETHRKRSSSGNIEPKSELIIIFFFKVTLKTAIVNSES